MRGRESNEAGVNTEEGRKDGERNGHSRPAGPAEKLKARGAAGDWRMADNPTK